jgi:hypothetical protein
VRVEDVQPRATTRAQDNAEERAIPQHGPQARDQRSVHAALVVPSGPTIRAKGGAVRGETGRCTRARKPHVFALREAARGAGFGAFRRPGAAASRSEGSQKAACAGSRFTRPSDYSDSNILPWHCSCSVSEHAPRTR